MSHPFKIQDDTEKKEIAKISNYYDAPFLRRKKNRNISCAIRNSYFNFPNPMKAFHFDLFTILALLQKLNLNSSSSLFGRVFTIFVHHSAATI